MRVPVCSHMCTGVCMSVDATAARTRVIRVLSVSLSPAPTSPPPPQLLLERDCGEHGWAVLPPAGHIGRCRQTTCAGLAPGLTDQSDAQGGRLRSP